MAAVNRKRILVIGTGGTLVMGRTDPNDRDSPIEVIPGFLKKYMDTSIAPFQDLPEYVVEEWDPIKESADIEMADWVQIANQVHANYNDYDGFVVAHGTDTMAYSASAVSFILQNLGKPVVFTGGQIPLSETFNDSRNNLIAAMRVAGDEDVAEVCITFDTQLFRGNRSKKVDPWFQHGFDSPNFPALTKMGVRYPWEYTDEPFDHRHDGALELSVTTPEEFYRKIFVLWLVPGFKNMEMSEILRRLRDYGIIIAFYGIGNGPDASNDDEGFLAVLQQLKENGNEIVMITQTGRGAVDPTTYPSGEGFADVVILGYDLTVEAAYTKLSMLMGQGKRGARLKHEYETSIRGEMTVAEDDCVRLMNKAWT